MITVTSSWARWRLKSPASRLFTQPFIQGADQRKHQSSASLAFVRGIHRGTVWIPYTKPSNVETVSIWWRHHVIDQSLNAGFELTNSQCLTKSTVGMTVKFTWISLDIDRELSGIRLSNFSMMIGCQFSSSGNDRHGACRIAKLIHL